MKHIIFVLIAAVLIAAMAACSAGGPEDGENMTELLEEPKQTAAEEKEGEQQPEPPQPDPQGALEEIYAQLDRSSGLVDATDEEMSDVMGFDLDTIEEYYVRYMETDFGVSDVYIIKPVDGQEETVRQDLKDWQEARTRAFMDYDIYNSTSISANAVIFQRGEYLVMLMLEDNDAARSIIDAHIPEALDLDD